MKYFIKKITALLITLFFITVAAFLVFQIVPGDPAMLMLDKDATNEQIEALRKELGLNKPIYIRYGTWALGLIQGDLGESYVYRIPITELLDGKLFVTIVLTIVTFVCILLLSIPMGLIHAKYAEKSFGKCLYVVNQIWMAIPPFFLGILIILLFGLILKWFTPGKYVSYEESFTSFLIYMIAPAMSIALPKSAMVVKFLRNSVLSQKDSDYVRTAYSKGNTENRVLYAHILKNACIPVITILGMMVAETMAGSIVVEQVFGLPGIGRLLISSIGSRDYPVVQAIIVYAASVVIIVNTLVDVLYRIMDPRIRRAE